MNVLLDTGILGKLCHPRFGRAMTVDMARFLRENQSLRILLPEVADYELRRKLLHLIPRNRASPASLARLNELGTSLRYLPLDTPMIRYAAQLWANSRLEGRPTSDDRELDADVILAAQTTLVEGKIVTMNRRHLSRFVPTLDWHEIPGLRQ